MSLRQLPQPRPITIKTRIVTALCAALLAASATRAEGQYAGTATTYSGSPAAMPSATSAGRLEATGTSSLNRLVTDLKHGGYVIVLRHGATNPDQADTDPFHLQNISAQRLLSEQGREAASAVGDAFRKLGIPLGKVYSSEFNRATETAKLVSGKDVTATRDLSEGGLVVSPAENARRAKVLKEMASTAPEPGVNTLIVTHKPNILDAFGADWFNSKEGEASVFKPDGSSNLVLVARIQAADWIKAASGY